MNFNQELFLKMKELQSQNDEKFFINYHEYEGKFYCVLDYSLVMPFHFYEPELFDFRGSLVEVDKDGNFIRFAALPFEKFFNLHEYDYEGCEPLYEAIQKKYGINIAGSEDIKNQEIEYVTYKEDGSIISTFHHNGELDAKSNSSLTSEYKYMALDLLRDNEELYSKTKTLTLDNWTVIFELTSKNPKYQIVLPYYEDKLIVLGARNIGDGSYMSYDDLVSYFGEDNVVSKVTEWDWNDQETKTDIEGYVVTFKSGMKIKLKTEWYVGQHKVRTNITSSPRYCWEAYINKELDDIYASLANNSIHLEYFNDLVKKCDVLYNNMMKEVYHYYDANKHLDAPDFFDQLSSTHFDIELGKRFVARLYQCEGDKEVALKYIHHDLLIKRNISKLGITNW